MEKLNNKLNRKDKIRILNEIYKNGLNPILFEQPKTYIFLQDLRDRNTYKMEDKYFTEEEMHKFEQEINNRNSYLIEKQIFKHEKLSKVITIAFKEGKKIL